MRLALLVLTSLLICLGCSTPKRYLYVPASSHRDTAYNVKHTFSILSKKCLGKVSTNKVVTTFNIKPAIVLGEVRDKQKRPIANCIIEIAEKSTMHIIATLVTDSAGSYEKSIPAGDYDIEYNLEERESVEIEKVHFAMGEKRLINICMGNHATYTYYEFWTKNKLGREEYFDVERYVRHHKRYRIKEPE